MLHHAAANVMTGFRRESDDVRNDLHVAFAFGAWYWDVEIGEMPRRRRRIAYKSHENFPAHRTNMVHNEGVHFSGER